MDSAHSNERDATRFAAEGLHVMSKPIGPICNLDCEYCYYLHKEDLYPIGESWRMPDEMLETYIEQYIAAQPASAEEVTFAWQGGEPTLLGISFFQRAIELQRKLTPRGVRIVNTLQTNGVLLDDDWCRFFRENDFLIGLSIDGPAELHDRYRYDKQGRGSFHAVLRALKLLKQFEVEFNVLVTVNRINGDHGRRVYTYLRDNGVRYLQFIPIVERSGVGAHREIEASPDATSSQWDKYVSSRSVRPEQFGNFLVDVFDEWIRHDVGKVFVQIFDQALSAWMGMEPSLCVFRKNCGRALAIEHNGDLYSCDHFVEPRYLLGNIHDLPIIELANSQKQIDFGTDKSASLPHYCRQCEVRFVCNGECPKNRFIQTPDGDEGLNYLCAGYRQFFNHIDPCMQMMAEELKEGRAAANVMHRLKEAGGSRSKKIGTAGIQTASVEDGRVGRNDPCPCGSGRKYKKCCIGG